MKLTFRSPSARMQPSFWQELYDYKLSQLLLDTSHRVIKCSFDEGDWNFRTLKVDASQDSFDATTGALLVLNTIDEFKKANKQQLLQQYAQSILLRKLYDGSAIDNPSLLSSFLLMVFADLKRYSFTYWFASPVFVPEIPFTCENVESLINHPMLPEIYLELINNWNLLSLSQNLICGVIQENEKYKIVSLRHVWDRRNEDEVLLVFIDPMCQKLHSNSSAIGWRIRNFLALLATEIPRDIMDYRVNILCLRGDAVNLLISGREILQENYVDQLDDTLLFHHIDLNNSQINITELESIKPKTFSFPFGIVETIESKLPKIIGWELNERGKPGPRFADLSLVMDTRKLMSQAIDLNLRLMRWRMWQNLDLSLLQKTRCLLLGSGTLGCNVGRILLGWGVRSITFVDNGKVSYSNPARQSLFEYQDAVSHGDKAITAALALKKIFPDVDSQGIVLEIPMPGHLVGQERESLLQRDLNTFHDLVQQHDAIFLLTDSREARWLPTVACRAENKLLINAALGFDSYLVMRHGVSSNQGGTVGCYFCQDIVAARNSQQDRSIDQQCTVTRPGLAYIASALSCEMMVALLQLSRNGDPIPHQIRGSLLDFHQIELETPCFPQCTACSESITAEYRKNKFELMKRACNDPSYLESLSGIDQLVSNINLDDCVESDDEF